MSNNKESSVDNEFIPYEQALELKQLGFDGHCFAFYREEYVENIPKWVDELIASSDKKFTVIINK